MCIFAFQNGLMGLMWNRNNEFDKYSKTCVHVANEGTGATPERRRAVAEVGADASFTGSEKHGIWKESSL